jgi:PAS domain S-box-containing protein
MVEISDKEYQQIRRLATVVKDSNDAILVMDVEGRITAWNRGAKLIFGYSEKEALQMNIQKLTPPNKAAEQKDFIRRLLAGEEITSFETQRLAKDGRLLDIWLTVTKLVDNAGKIILIATTERDITERKKAEKELQENEAKFRSVIENSGDQIFMLDKDNRFLLINKTVAALARKSPQEIIGKTIFEIFSGITAFQFSENTKKVFETGKSLTLDEKMIIRGQEFYNSTSLNPVKDEKGRVIAVSGIVRDITEHMREEHELHKSNEYFRLMAENSSQIILMMDKKGTLLYASPSIERLLNYKPDEVIGKSAFAFIHPADLPRAVFDFGKAILTKDTYIHNSFRIMLKDGSDRILDGFGINLLDNPYVKGFLMDLQDVTERKLAEEQLKESEEKYRALIENAGETILVAQDGQFKFINGKSLDLIGYRPDELAGKQFTDYIHPDDRKMVGERYVQRLKGEEPPNNYPFRVLNINGQTKWVQISAVRINWEGRPATLNFLTDISESKKAEEKIRQSEEQYRLLADNIIDIVYILDLKTGRYQYISPSAERVFGYSEKEAMALKPQDVMTPESFQRQFDSLNGAMQAPRGSRKNSEIMDLELVRKDGSTFWGEINARFILDDNGDPISILGVMRDITERKKSQEEAQKVTAAEKEKKRTSDLLSIMSHELQTPLTPIIVYASLFLSEKYGKLAPKYLETADIIKKESEHLQAMIRNFLDAAQIVGNVPLRFNKKTVPVKPIIDELLAILWAQFEVKGISVEVSLPEKFPLLSIDEEKIREVFSNLLVNAMKFTPNGGKVKVTGEVRDKDVLFRVIDNGIGIAPENLQKIFEKFFQTDSSITRTAEGMGLGLAIAKEFVTMHGGKIWAESEGLGKGSRFIFTLPTEEDK